VNQTKSGVQHPLLKAIQSVLVSTAQCLMNIWSYQPTNQPTNQSFKNQFVECMHHPIIFDTGKLWEKRSMVLLGFKKQIMHNMCSYCFCLFLYVWGASILTIFLPIKPFETTTTTTRTDTAIATATARTELAALWEFVVLGK
jgi:hypothetical protein